MPWILLIIVIASAEFVVSNHWLKGYLRDPLYLAKEIKTPPDHLQDYRITEEAPFSYRVMFPAIVKSTFSVFFDDGDNAGFYFVYRLWSWIFFVLSAIALFLLIREAGFTSEWSFVGTMIFLLMPATLFAFTLPVHTREDTLAYTLLFAGLIFLLRQNTFMVTFISIAGVLTRETLLILPLLWILFVRKDSIAKQLPVLAIPLSVWLSVRSLVGAPPYDPWLGLKWNLSNPEQVIGFLFIAFNFLWVTMILLIRRRQISVTSNDTIRFFHRSAFFTLVVIIVTTFVGGIYNEIRLLTIAMPWMIVVFLSYARKGAPHIVKLLKTNWYLIFGGCMLIICGVGLWFLLQHRASLIEPGKYAVPYDQWIVSAVVYIFITVLIIPLFVGVDRYLKANETN